MRTLKLVLEERRGDTVYRVERCLSVDLELFRVAPGSILESELLDMEKALEKDVEITNQNRQ